MEKLAIDSVPTDSGRSATVSRNIAEGLDTSDMGIQYYVLEPGDYLGRTYHMHQDQEEIFLPLEGKVTFETEAGEIVVEEGEIIRFARGDYQRGSNQSSARAVVLGLGAPKNPSYDEAERLRYCSECDKMTSQQNEEVTDGVATVCVECGNETGRWG